MRYKLEPYTTYPLVKNRTINIQSSLKTFWFDQALFTYRQRLNTIYGIKGYNVALNVKNIIIIIIALIDIFIYRFIKWLKCWRCLVIPKNLFYFGQFFPNMYSPADRDYIIVLPYRLVYKTNKQTNKTKNKNKNKHTIKVFYDVLLDWITNMSKILQ